MLMASPLEFGAAAPPKAIEFGAADGDELPNANAAGAGAGAGVEVVLPPNIFAPVPPPLPKMSPLPVDAAAPNGLLPAAVLPNGLLSPPPPNGEAFVLAPDVLGCGVEPNTSGWWLMLPPKLNDPALVAAGADAGAPKGLLEDAAAEEPNGSLADEDDEAPNGLLESAPNGFELLLLLLLLAAPNGLADEALDANGLPNILTIWRGLCGHSHTGTHARWLKRGHKRRRTKKIKITQSQAQLSRSSKQANTRSIDRSTL